LVLLRALGQIPHFVRLLLGLLTDRRVDLTDKLLVGAALAYIAMPADMVVDYVPFLGLVDDLFLVALTIRRLIRNAGFRVALRYWHGERSDLKRLRVEEVILAASAFLPRPVRRRLAGRVDWDD
jgi:uncharacterized membrane protein YkvA (DUF1232 family)